MKKGLLIISFILLVKPVLAQQVDINNVDLMSPTEITFAPKQKVLTAQGNFGVILYTIDSIAQVHLEGAKRPVFFPFEQLGQLFGCGKHHMCVPDHVRTKTGSGDAFIAAILRNGDPIIYFPETKKYRPWQVNDLVKL